MFEEGQPQQDVTQGAEQKSPIDQIAEASTSDAAIERDPAETRQPEEPVVSDQSNQSGKDYNWKQMREQVRQLNSQIKALEGASNLEKWLKSNPNNLRMIMDMMDGKGRQAPVSQQNQPRESQNLQQEDPYKEWDPVAAEKFRKLDALEQWKAELERQQEQQKLSQQEKEKENEQRNMADLDADFDERLIKDGFMAEDGACDQDLVDMIRDATLARIARKFGNPTNATRVQLQEAYKAVTAGLSAHQKFTLKKTVHQDVPLSGSTRGSVPNGKTSMSEHDRLNTIMSSL